MDQMEQIISTNEKLQVPGKDVRSTEIMLPLSAKGMGLWPTSLNEQWLN